MKFDGKSSFIYKDEKVEFNYVKNPTLTQKMKIVEGMINGVINDTTGYQPILRDYFTTVSLLVELTDIKLPESFVLSEEYIRDADLEATLYNIVDEEVIEEINDAFEEQIEFIKAREVAKSPLDDLIRAITMVVEKYGEMFDGLDVNEVSANLAKISEMANIPGEEIVQGILKYKNG